MYAGYQDAEMDNVAPGPVPGCIVATKTHAKGSHTFVAGLGITPEGCSATEAKKGESAVQLR